MKDQGGCKEENGMEESYNAIKYVQYHLYVATSFNTSSYSLQALLNGMKPASTFYGFFCCFVN